LGLPSSGSPSLVLVHPSPFMRRLLVRLPFVLAALCASLASSRSLAATAARPNILFAIADDWGAHAGAYGTPWVKTPAFDRVAREGLLFKNAFTPMAKCAPSRAIVLTGRQLWQLEAAANHMPYFPAKFKSWPEAMSEKGWFVGITGKGWGPGVANDANGQPRQITGKPFNQRTTPPPARAVSPNDYAANFRDFLDAAPKDTPWCFWYGAHEPHRAYEFKVGVTKGGKQLTDIARVPAYWPDNDTVRHDILDYAYEVEHADAHLGRMLDELARRGQLDNTLVVVTADHGMPFPRAKGYAYPASNHVPLAIRWPGGITQPGRVIEDFVDFTDLAPTFLDVAGISESSTGMAPITGRSWREIFASPKSGRVIAARDHVLIGKERTDTGRPNDGGYPIRGLIRDGFLYLRNDEPTRWPAGNPETGYLDTDGSPTKSLILERGRAQRTDRFWQLNFGLRPGEELYDLKQDPDCVTNLAAESAHATRRTQMREFLHARLKAQGDPRALGQGEVFDRYPVATENSRDFYGRYQRGEKPQAGWVSPTDAEKEPLK
jgi:N-sulfoglucosamine sulfohydrolase